METRKIRSQFSADFLKGEFDESKHPRANDGKFDSVSGGSNKSGDSPNQKAKTARREIKIATVRIDELRSKMDAMERVDTDDKRREYNQWHSEWTGLRAKVAELQRDLPNKERPKKGPPDKWSIANPGK